VIAMCFSLFLKIMKFAQKFTHSGFNRGTKSTPKNAGTNKRRFANAKCEMMPTVFFAQGRLLN